MGRVKVEVNVEILRDCINQVEKEFPDVGQTKGWELVTKLYSEKDKKTSFTTLKKQGLSLNIQSKARGNSNLASIRPTSNGSQNRNRPSPEAVENMKKMIIDHKVTHHLPLVDKWAKGSVKAAIKLNCLQCMGFSSSMVKKCTSKVCPYVYIRPYQTKDEEEE